MEKEQSYTLDSAEAAKLAAEDRKEQQRIVSALNRVRNPAAYDDLMGDSGQYVVPEEL